jgi:hypothetical protein
MAIFWPTGTQEQVRAGEALRRALSSAVALIGGGAGMLALNDTGATEEAGSGVAQRDGEVAVLAYGIRLEAALSLANRLASNAVPLPMDGRPRVSVLPEYWGGEIATLALADAGGAIGEVHLLGPAGFFHVSSAGRRAPTPGAAEPVDDGDTTPSGAHPTAAGESPVELDSLLQRRRHHHR